jgi:hypothetical protein
LLHQLGKGLLRQIGLCSEDQSLKDDSDFLQKFIDEGKPLPAGEFVIRKPLLLGRGAYIVAGPTTAAKDDVSKEYWGVPTINTVPQAPQDILGTSGSPATSGKAGVMTVFVSGTGSGITLNRVGRISRSLSPLAT